MINSNIEILRGDPKDSLWKLSIPIMVTMIITSLYNVVDGIWVAGLGQSAIAGIGIVTPLWMILHGLAAGLGNGATSSISRFREKYGDEKSNTAGYQSTVIFLVASVILTVILFLVLKPLISIYNPGAETSKHAVEYSIPLFLGLVGHVLSCGFAGILRAEGDTQRAMYATSFGLILNAILDPVFIYLLNMGSGGAAVSTIITASISALIMGYWIFIKKDTYIRIKFKDNFKSKWDWSITKDILNTGIPASGVQFTLSFGVVMFNFFINIIAGDLGVSIFGTGTRVYLLGLTPITSMCAALLAIMGTHYGGGNLEYVKRTHTYCCLYTFIVGCIVCALFVIFSKQLAHVFVVTSNDMELINGIAQFISITAFCIPFLGLGLPSSFTYQGLGKGIYSFLWTIMYDIICVLPAVYFFAFYMNYGLIGVWLGFVAGRATASILNFLGAKYTLKKLENIKKEIN